MINKIIDGRSIAKRVLDESRSKVTVLKNDGITPCLSIMQVGNDPRSNIYIKNKMQRCHDIGIDCQLFKMSEQSSEQDVLSQIKLLNNDKTVHGIIVQLPLPKHINVVNVINAIDPLKDVDGFHPINVGKLISNQPCFIPCTPQGCITLLNSVIDDYAGLNAVVIGRSSIVGKPMSYLLTQKNCTVTLAHSLTKDLESICNKADIIVSAIGKKHMIDRQHIKDGAIVIDVGISSVDGQLFGDVNTKNVMDKVKFITPVPGGVGPMTIACLIKNTLQAASLSEM